MLGLREPIHYSVFCATLEGRIEDRIEFLGVHPDESERKVIIV
jgi:hypothetical protein